MKSKKKLKKPKLKYKIGDIVWYTDYNEITCEKINIVNILVDPEDGTMDIEYCTENSNMENIFYSSFDKAWKVFIKNRKYY